MDNDLLHKHLEAALDALSDEAEEQLIDYVRDDGGMAELSAVIPAHNNFTDNDFSYELSAVVDTDEDGEVTFFNASTMSVENTDADEVTAEVSY